VVPVDAAVLARHALPGADEVANKNERGSVLVVGGSAETPGGVLLAGVAALRAGAGRVQIATVERATGGLAAQFPEARVTPLPHTKSGAISPDAGPLLGAAVAKADAVLVGTGAIDPDATTALLEALLPALAASAALVVDAAALPGFDSSRRVLAGEHDRVVLLPNPGEMAALLDVPFARVDGDPLGALRDAVARFAATVALRDTTTWIGAPGGVEYRDGSGDPALATSGSGDVLAGCVAGLAARGASPLAAVLWGVHAHGCAGSRLAERYGGTGLLARELVDLLPSELNARS
jgi:ADP-dependent NAD(P)H-hydrate dehydratase